MLKRIALLCTLVVASIAAAQEASTAPPPELKKLEWMVGEWSGKVRWSMPGMEGEEEMSFKNEWEGQFLKSTSKMAMSGQTMTELAMTGWNAKTKKYDTYTFTNFAPAPRVEHADLENDKMVSLSDPWDVMGMAMTSRATMIKKSADEIAFVLEFKMGEDWQKVGEGTFKKKKS